MKRCSIVIHSVSGNCYIIGSYLKEALSKRNVDVRFYRVEDPDLHIWANREETVNDYYEDIVRFAGGDEELESKYHEAADLMANEETRTQYIRAYAEANGLNITAYQDYGWDPVELN